MSKSNNDDISFNETKIKSLEKENMQMKEIIENDKKEIKQKEEEINKLRKNWGKSKEINHAKNENEIINEKVNASIQLHKSNEVLLNVLNDIKSSLSPIKNNFDDLSEINVNEDENELKDIIISKLKMKISELMDELRIYKNKNEELFEENKMKDGEIGKLNEKVDIMKNIKDCKSNVSDYYNENSINELIKLKQEVDDLQTQLELISKDLENQENENSFKDILIEQLKERIQNLLK